MNQLLSPQLLKYPIPLLICNPFFFKRMVLEIDTPALKSVPGMEPYLDPMFFSAQRHGRISNHIP